MKPKRFESPYIDIRKMDDIWELVKAETEKAVNAYGDYRSVHEIYAIIKEELDEFWDSIKERDVDPHELLQIASSAIFAILWIAKRSQIELDQ